MAADLGRIALDAAREITPAFDAARLAEEARWPVAPGLAMLNHGSYGCVPAAVHMARVALLERVQQDAVRFFKVDLERLIDVVRSVLGVLCNAEPEGFAAMPNATAAVATALHAAELGPGDEVLVTNHEYQATLNELERLSAVRGIRVRTARIPWPEATPEGVVRALFECVTDRTRLIVASHVASASSLVLPVAEICARARAIGISTLIDGAHAPGQVPIDLGAIGADFYAASCHKWLCTPNGSGWLWTGPHVRHRTRPLALSCRSHRVRPGRARYLCDFDYQGTCDFTPFLTIPAAAAHLSVQHELGLAGLMGENHGRVVSAARGVLEASGLASASAAGADLGTLAPAEMTGSMVTLRLPGEPVPGRLYDDGLWDALAERHRVQAPVWHTPSIWPRVLRVSAQRYNTEAEYARLGVALAAELGGCLGERRGECLVGGLAVRAAC